MYDRRVTDRIRRITVVLERDYRDDDVQPILSALRMVKGVSIVEPHVATGSEQINREIAKDELRRELWDKLTDLLMPGRRRS